MPDMIDPNELNASRGRHPSSLPLSEGEHWPPTVRRVRDVTWRMWRADAGVQADLDYLGDYFETVPNARRKVLTVVAQTRRN